MPLTAFRFPLTALCALLFASSALAADAPALKDAFAGKFVVGAAINPGMTKPDSPVHDLLLQQFNAISPTNALKWAVYNPEPGVYNEAPADDYFAFGQAHHMYILAHCLFWHAQTPKWVFQGADGKPATREELVARMRERVHHVAQRFGAKANAWDVVNETFNDNGTLRDSPWTKILGADFLPTAFRLANEELPKEVALLYNDYNMESPAKTAAVVKLVQDLRAQGLRVDGVGNQAHWRLETPTIAQIDASLAAFQQAGIKVHFTELDIEVLPRKVNGAEVSFRESLTPENNPYPNGLPPEIQQKLAQRYADIFAVFVKYADTIERVTFWGVTDGDSWLNNWPVRGRTNYPLLFDRQGHPKPAFSAVIGTVSGKR